MRPLRERQFFSAMLFTCLIGSVGCKGKHAADARAFAEEICIDTARNQIQMKPMLTSISSLVGMTVNMADKVTAQDESSRHKYESEIASMKRSVQHFEELDTLPFYS